MPTSLWETIFDAAIDAIVVANGKGLIQAFNPSAEQMFGYSFEEVYNQNLRMLMPEPDASQHDQYMRSYQKTGKARIIGKGRDVIARHKDGTTFPVHLSVGEVEQAADSGVDRTFVGILHDLTERTEVERRSREHQTMFAAVARMNLVGELAQGIVHEVSQPLSAVTNYAQALINLEKSGETTSPEQRVELLKKIGQQAERAGAILGRLRSFIRHREPTLERIAVQPRLESALALIEPESAEQNVRVELTPADPAIEIMADPVQIEQILLNLLKNAIDATSESGGTDAVQLTATRNGSRVEISVRDRGPGVDPSIEADMFNYFVSTKRFGMGMGLNLSSTIALAFGGRIEHRRPAGGGALFVLTLPIVESPAEELT